MKVIVAQQTEQGMEIVGNEEGNGPLVFDNIEQATERLVSATGLPAEVLSVIFNFYELTEEELEELIERVGQN